MVPVRHPRKAHYRQKKRCVDIDDDISIWFCESHDTERCDCGSHTTAGYYKCTVISVEDDDAFGVCLWWDGFLVSLAACRVVCIRARVHSWSSSQLDR